MTSTEEKPSPEDDDAADSTPTSPEHMRAKTESQDQPAATYLEALQCWASQLEAGGLSNLVAMAAAMLVERETNPDELRGLLLEAAQDLPQESQQRLAEAAMWMLDQQKLAEKGEGAA